MTVEGLIRTLNPLVIGNGNLRVCLTEDMLSRSRVALKVARLFYFGLQEKRYFTAVRNKIDF